MENFKNITTGPHPSSSGACQAQFNHHTYSHFHNHNYNNYPNYPNYPIPHYTNGYIYPSIPTWRLPTGYHPQYY